MILVILMATVLNTYVITKEDATLTNMFMFHITITVSNFRSGTITGGLLHWQYSLLSFVAAAIAAFSGDAERDPSNQRLSRPQLMCSNSNLMELYQRCSNLILEDSLRCTNHPPVVSNSHGPNLLLHQDILVELMIHSLKVLWTSRMLQRI